MTDMTLTNSGPGVFKRIWDLMGRRPELFTLALVILTVIGVAIANPDFLAVNNLFDILRASVVRGILQWACLPFLPPAGSMYRLPRLPPSSCTR